jgi:hypothetical protein
MAFFLMSIVIAFFTNVLESPSVLASSFRLMMNFPFDWISVFSFPFGFLLCLFFWAVWFSALSLVIQRLVRSTQKKAWPE